MVQKKNKKKENLGEVAYRAIKEMILLNRFKPGLRFNAERLSRELGLSHTPVWKAIRILEREGSVRRVRNRGVIVVQISLERVLEQVLVLNALNRMGARLACSRMNAGTLEKLYRCLSEQLQGIESEDLVCYGEAEIQFHRVICEASGLSYLVEVFDFITTTLTPSLFNFLPTLPGMYLANVELVEAFRDRDHDRVQKAINEHVQVIVDAINQ